MAEKSDSFKRSFFPKPKKSPSPVPAMPSVGVNELAGRLRIYEARYSELRKNLVVIEQNMLSFQKKTNHELKGVYSELSELRRQVTDMQDKITMIIKELGLLATKSEVKVLSKTLDYLDPIKFVRIDQVRELVNEMIDERLGEEQEEEESLPKSL